MPIADGDRRAGSLRYRDRDWLAALSRETGGDLAAGGVVDPDHDRIIVLLAPKDPLLGRNIAGEVAVSVQMVGREIEPNRHPAA